MSVSINSFITNTDETLRTDDGNTFFFLKILITTFLSFFWFWMQMKVFIWHD